MFDILLPAIGAGVGYYVLKNRRVLGHHLGGTEALILGLAGGLAIQFVMNKPPTLYPSRLRSGGAYAPTVVTGRQPGTNQFIF